MAEDTEGRSLWDFFKRRKINYQTAKHTEFAIEQPATQDMLIDLADFCRAGETCVALDMNGKVDMERTLILEGRREVWLRMMNHFHLTTDQLYLLYTGKQFNPGE